jgi:hypothetical protein
LLDRGWRKPTQPVAGDTETVPFVFSVNLVDAKL